MIYFIQATYKNGHERLINLKSQMKIEPFPRDILQLMCIFNDKQDTSMSDCENMTKTDVEDDRSSDDVHHTKSHFIEIGELRCGSIFGLGEQMDDRVIVAKHKEVQCLLIPQYWLLQKKQNTGNIWHR